MIGGALLGRLLGWAGGAGLPWVLGGVAAAAAAGWIWIQGQRIDGLQDDLQAAAGRAARAESANDELAAEIMRQAFERARNEAALAAERDAAIARATARGRALQEIHDAPDANQPFSPGVADAVRGVYRAGPPDR